MTQTYRTCQMSSQPQTDTDALRKNTLQLDLKVHRAIVRSKVSRNDLIDLKSTICTMEEEMNDMQTIMKDLINNPKNPTSERTRKMVEELKVADQSA